MGIASRQPRAFVPAVLLLVQAFAVGHLALARHTLSDTGELVDTAPLVKEEHDGRRAHLCAGDTSVAAVGSDECVVLASTRTPSLASPSAVFLAAQAPHPLELSGSPLVRVQLEVLSRAPKASPPQG